MVSYIYPCLKTEKYGKMKCCKYCHKNVFQNKQFLFSAPVQFQKQWHTPEILYLPNFCQIYIAVWNRIKLNSSTFQKFNQQAELTAEMKSLRIRKVFSQILRRVSVSEEQEVLFFFLLCFTQQTWYLTYVKLSFQHLITILTSTCTYLIHYFYEWTQEST